MAPKKKLIGKKIKIHLNKANIFESHVIIDGHSIHGVEKIEVIASSNWKEPPRVVLHLHPDLVEVDGQADVEAFFQMEKKYGRFDDLDID